jgi:hypothetical protein
MELLQDFGMLFLWAFLSVGACLILMGVFALAWIPMVHWMFRYNDRMGK